jgi:hypothetical protein
MIIDKQKAEIKNYSTLCTDYENKLDLKRKEIAILKA